MATIQWFLTDTKASGVNHLDVSLTTFAAADSSTGWSGSGGGAVAGEYSDLYANVARAATTFTAPAKPTTIDATNGNGWRLTSSSTTGTFAAGNWSLSFRLKAISGANGTTDAGVSYLFWKSSNADGSGGTTIGTQQVTGYGANIPAGGRTVTATYDPSGGAGFSLSGEYLFMLAALQIDPAGGVGTDTIGFSVGAVTSAMTSTDFTVSSGGVVGQSQSLRNALRRRRRG